MRITLGRFVLAVGAGLAMLPSARAYDPDHLAQLLETKSCVGCDLREADLSQVDLAFADLTGANLEAVRLDGASLICARLGETNLIRADLQNANVMGALLAGADMTGANLRGATLLRNALWEATRDNVILDGAVFFRSMSDAGLWNVDCGDERPRVFGG